MELTASPEELLPPLPGVLSGGESLETTVGAPTQSPNSGALTDVALFLDTYYVPSLIVLGTLGNMLSFAVFLSPFMRQLSLSVYLSALAFSDTVFLLTLAMGWIKVSGAALFHQSGWCQLTIYFSYVSSFLSSWFVVSFTIERYIAICHPLRRPEMCTTSRAKYVVAGMTAFGVLGYTCSMWTTGTYKMNNATVCTPLREYYNVHLVTTYVDLAISLIVPFTIIFLLNIKIAYSLRLFSSRNKKTRNKGTLGTWNRTQITVSELGNRAQVTVTKLLLIISTVFLVINLPSYIMRFHMFVITFKYHKQRTKDDRIQQLVQFVYYLNFGINFYLYSLWSKRFRQGLARLLWQARYKIQNLAERSYRLLKGSSVAPPTSQVELAVMPFCEAPQPLRTPVQQTSDSDDKNKVGRSSGGSKTSKSNPSHSSGSSGSRSRKAMYLD